MVLITMGATRKGTRRIRALAWALLGVGCCSVGHPSDSTPAVSPISHPDYVVLLHGMARTERSMEPLAERVAGEGYRVFNVGYPGRKLTPDELVTVLRTALDDCCTDAKRLHLSLIHI